MNLESRGLSLEDDVAIITGAGQGIGRETALLFAQRGAKVILADMNVVTIEHVAAEIEAQGGFAYAIRTDVTQTTELDDLVEAALDYGGKVNALVNNAGIAGNGRMFKQSDEEFEQVIGINLIAPRHLSKRVAAAMEKGGIKGSISNASSTTAQFGLDGQTAYGASKSGIESLTRAMAKEYGRVGIRVNAVAPGPVDTPMLRDVPDASLEAFKNMTVLGRLADPIEIARTYAWLASDEASYLTGEILHVDGGYKKG